MTRDQIVQAATELKGQPWLHRGRTRAGMDCVGMVIILAKGFDMAVEDMDGYGRQAQGETFVEQLKKHLVISEQRPAKGRIAVFRDHNYPCHVGIMNEPSPGRFTLIHATVARRKVVEEPWDRDWSSKLRLYLDFPNVED